jgi:hypothetical protein
VAAVAAFAAHEPLLILLGHRGKRARGEAGQRASRRLAVLAAAGGAAAGLAAYLAPGAAALALAPGAAAVALGGFLFRRRERTIAAEVLAGAALSGAGLPVALASGWPLSAALGAWAGWAAGFAAIVSVVWPIAHKRALGPVARTLASLIPALIVASAGSVLGAQAVAAGAPLIAAGLAITAVRPAGRLLRPIGWMIAATTVAQAVAVVVLGR